jgi:hypothetical protein
VTYAAERQKQRTILAKARLANRIEIAASAWQRAQEALNRPDMVSRARGYRRDREMAYYSAVISLSDSDPGITRSIAGDFPRAPSAI